MINILTLGKYSTADVHILSPAHRGVLNHPCVNENIKKCKVHPVAPLCPWWYCVTWGGPECSLLLFRSAARPDAHSNLPTPLRHGLGRWVVGVGGVGLEH